MGVRLVDSHWSGANRPQLVASAPKVFILAPVAQARAGTGSSEPTFRDTADSTFR